MRNPRTVRARSGLRGWRGRLRSQYASESEWKYYSSMYGLARRLGFKSAAAAWRADPVIEGSVEPGDFRIAPKAQRRKGRNPRSLAALKREAASAAKWRGHSLGKWVDAPSRRYASAECRRCGKFVIVRTRPMPNEIDIGGPAVAVGCAGARRNPRKARRSTARRARTSRRRRVRYN